MTIKQFKFQTKQMKIESIFLIKKQKIKEEILCSELMMETIIEQIEIKEEFHFRLKNKNARQWSKVANKIIKKVRRCIRV